MMFQKNIREPQQETFAKNQKLCLNWNLADDSVEVLNPQIGCKASGFVHI
jgi:hypothetical protein